MKETIWKETKFHEGDNSIPHSPSSKSDTSSAMGSNTTPCPFETAAGPMEKQYAAFPDGLSFKEFIEKLDTCVADIKVLQRKQEQIIQKQEEADTVRRGQIDCISERVFCAEKNLRQTEQRQDDAISKASATFQKHAFDVEQEKQNLMCVISQVNQNFEHLSSEITQQSTTVTNLEQHIGQLQSSINETTCDMRDIGMTMATLGHTVSSLERNMLQQQRRTNELQMLEQAVQQQQQQISVLQMSTQAIHDTVLRMASHSAFAEATQRHQALNKELPEARNLCGESQGQGLADQFAEVAHILNEETGGSTRSTRQQRTRPPSMGSSLSAPHTASHDEVWRNSDVGKHTSEHSQRSSGHITNLLQMDPTMPIGDHHWRHHETAQFADDINGDGGRTNGPPRVDTGSPSNHSPMDLGCTYSEGVFDGKEVRYERRHKGRSKHRTCSRSRVVAQERSHPSSGCFDLLDVPPLSQAGMCSEPTDLDGVDTLVLDSLFHDQSPGRAPPQAYANMQDNQIAQPWFERNFSRSLQELESAMLLKPSSVMSMTSMH